MTAESGKPLVIGISSRALFDLEVENTIFEEHGVAKYKEHQREKEKEILQPGTAFYLIEHFLKLNDLDPGKPLVEIVVMSRNSPETAIRVLHSLEHYKFDISRMAFAGGSSLHSYLDAYEVDLFLSRALDDVQSAIDNGIPAAVICDPPKGYNPVKDQIRIAFDGDSVLFSDESEAIFKEKGLKEFSAHEDAHRDTPLPDGPFAKLLKTLALLQKKLPRNRWPVRIALVTARSSPAHMRVINTLRNWDVDIDEAFFMGGRPKDKVLKAFRAHIFFDDQDVHLGPAAKVVPAGKVPYKSSSAMARWEGKKVALPVVLPAES
jgi:5'-nucleotidase